MGFETVRIIVKETVDIIWRKLHEQEMPVPCEELWKQTADGFADRWQFPLCIGAIDGKHCQLKAPFHSGSQYYNYKGHHSIVLMAVADAKSKFITIDVGSYGSASDGGIFQDSTLYTLLQTNRLNIPMPTKIPNTEIELPFVFVGDEAFPLMKNLMRPFPRRDLTDEKRIFNYRLSRARKQIECAFGVLASMWRILRKPMEVQEEFATNIVKAACILHNFILNREPERMKEVDTLSDDTPSRDITTARPMGRPAGDGIAVRNSFMEYFMTPSGSLQWQNNVLL